MPRAVIITSYLEHPLDIPSLLQPDDYIVCLDGGYAHAETQDITPDLLLGDFDSLANAGSIDPEALEAAADFEVRRYPPEKDYTDLELALLILDPAKTPDLLIIGGLGGRLDQTLVNIQMLQRYTAPPGSLPEKDPIPRYRRIEIMDGHHRCFVVHGDTDPKSGLTEDGPWVYTIPRAPDSYLSLIPLSEECGGVTLEGVKYPLSDAVLHRGATLSISNEFREDHASLRVCRGSLLVVVTRGNEHDF